jgi:hypothetical protein
MIVGLPKSGKTTIAKKIMFEKSNTYRLSLSEIKENNKLSHVASEKLYISTLRVLCSLGVDVILDDCNLDKTKHPFIESVVTSCGSSFKKLKVKTPLALCYLYDDASDSPVGWNEIYKCSLLNGMSKYRKGSVVVVDIDAVNNEILSEVKELFKRGKSVVLIGTCIDTSKVIKNLLEIDFKNWVDHEHDGVFYDVILNAKDRDSKEDVLLSHVSKSSIHKVFTLYPEQFGSF